jgi:hypothetical protein
MTKIGSWSANIPSLAPFLATASRRETLELRPSGSWTVIHANELESLFEVALPKLQQATTMKIDMTEVRELDTSTLVEPLSYVFPADQTISSGQIRAFRTWP